MSVIETNGLTKFYGKSRGIENVSLKVEDGEVFGFIGPNGAGKSTTIRTLLGLIKPTSGTARIFDKDITKDGALIRQEVGYLPSEVFYYDNMRVRDLLKYSASFYNKSRHDMEARKNVLAKQLDLDLNKKIQDLSYGNRKKVGIIQGLIHDPKLIILDEPTGGLDPLMQQTFFDILREESARGKTILFSSHILSEVQKLCHRVAIIKEGSIVATEEIDALRRNSYIKVNIELKAPITKSQLRLKGVSNVQASGSKVSFLYQGDVNAVVKVLSGIKLNKLLIEEPELEEIFMHYYAKD